MNYIQQGIIHSNQGENIQYNNTSEDEEDSNIIFIDTVFYMLCMITIIPSLTRCIYVSYIKNRVNDNNNNQVSLIDNVQSLIITDEQPEDVCSICLEEFEYNQELKKLKCNHIFHKECLESWINDKKICPLCRTGIL